MANGKLYTKIKPADALKALGEKLQGVKVQVVTPTTVKGEDGKDRPAMEARMVSLKAEHVLSAKKWANGSVTITTIDGKRYPENANTRVDENDELLEAAA